MDDNSKPKCKSIIERSVPHNLQQNITDKEFIESLFGKKVSLAYVIQSEAGEEVPIIQGKFCSNSSNEWMLLTILGKGKIIYLDFVYLSLILSDLRKNLSLKIYRPLNLCYMILTEHINVCLLILRSVLSTI